ncbi:hypothetical protein ACGFWE_13855 [Streptomyces sp. NPDC048523]|uniref:hypothetical protein n=1 Tax=Streptomyces sp. NPDC048523 TaxID=3365567 RepID=UPI003713B2DF
MPHDELPESLEAVLDAQDVERQDYDRARQVMTFMYQTGEDKTILGRIEGTVPVPVVGQTVRLWTSKVALVVEDVETFYGLYREDGEQFAEVTVRVKPRE